MILSGPSTVSFAESSTTGLLRKTCPEESLNPRPEGREPNRRGTGKKYAKSLRKRRSFLQTDYTCQVSFPLEPSISLDTVDDISYYEREPYLALGTPSLTVSSLQDIHGEPGLLETKALGLLAPLRDSKSKNPASGVMEMEPETMETKSVVDSRVSSISAIRLRIDPSQKENVEAVPLSIHLSSSLTSTPPSSHTSSPCPTQAFPLCQNSDSCVPEELTTELGDSMSSLSSADPDSDRVCSAISPGPDHASAGDTCQPGRHLQETGLGFLSTDQMQETVPQYTEAPQVSSGRGEHEENSGEKLASCPTNEKQRQVLGGSDRETATSCGARVDKYGSGEDSSGPLADVSDVALLGVSAPAGEMTSTLSLDSPVTGTEQTTSHSPGDPHRPNREIPGQSCQAPEQKLLAQLDVDSLFTVGSQTIASEFSVEGVQTESLTIVQEEGAPSGDLLLQVCPSPRPSLPKPLPCPQQQPSSEDLQPCLRPESKDKPPGICLPAEKSFPCFAAESHPEISASLHMATSLGFAGMNESMAPRARLEQCSCQLPYAACFRGLQLDPEEEDRDAETHPAVPLTSPPSAGSHLAWAQGCSPESLSRNSHIWPEYCSRTLKQLKATPTSTCEGFAHLTESLLELRHILEASWGNGHKHPPEKCTWYFSESRSRLCMGSQKLLSSCQHVIRMDQSPEEMQGALRDTFQHLVQLAGLCFQLTDCSRCLARHQEAAGHLRDVVHTYHQFVEATKLTCERGYHDLSVKLLARQCTALTAAVFCLNQKFRASPAM